MMTENWPFVVSTSEDTQQLGVGKLISAEEEIAVISYFDSPHSSNIEIEVPTDSLLRAIGEETTGPFRNTRVYFDDPESGWRIGRLIAPLITKGTLMIRFPGQEDGEYETDHIYFRWHKPVEDPSHYLAERLSETSLFADNRHAFMASIYNQRNASKGLSALISSRISLEAYQIKVVE